jgi:hypothetical protein
MPNLTILPDKILMIVFKNLIVEDVYALRVTCSRIKRVIDDLVLKDKFYWKEQVIRRWETVLWLPNNCYQVTLPIAQVDDDMHDLESWMLSWNTPSRVIEEYLEATVSDTSYQQWMFVFAKFHAIERDCCMMTTCHYPIGLSIMHKTVKRECKRF